MIFEKNILKKVLSNAFDIPINVTYWDGETEQYGDGIPQVYIIINEKIPLDSLMNTPTLVLAEAYMQEKIEIKGSIQKLVASAYRKQNSFITDQSKFNQSIISYLRGHSRKESSEDIHSHYDIGNDFYKKWLDPTMTYSCAYFKNKDMNLEEAQRAKIHYILDKLDSQPGNRLLDIGCGWGNLIFTAAQKYGLNTVGITLSKEQYNYIANKIETLGMQNKIKVLLVDYRDLKDQKFDYITSVGMFEHVGKDNLSKYFEKVFDYLVPNGRALIHGITGQHEGEGIDPFIIKYIFPGGYIPNVAENINHIMNAKLQIDDLESLRRHYQRTLEIWNTNYQSIIDDVEKEKGKSFSRMWSLYLQSCAASFESGNIDVIQYLLSKGPSGEGLPMTREYMYK